MGKQCIEVTPADKMARISEVLCIGCGICVKRCPFGAIQIINMPSTLQSEVTHRYGQNTFKLHRLPSPRPNEVLGLVGRNGIGKSTALKVLANRLTPNLGKYDSPPTWKEIIRYYRGSDLQGYFNSLVGDKFKALLKIQYVDMIAEMMKGKGSVGRVLRKRDNTGKLDYMTKELQLDHLLDRDVSVLSGGELQRFACCVLAVQEGDVYMFDEPSSYLDVKQRLKVAQVIREIATQVETGGEDTSSRYVICVEHDLAVLDYLSDFICCLYGEPGAYGVVTKPFSVREGINIFLAGYIPTENIRFRDEELDFHMSARVEETVGGTEEGADSAAAAGGGGGKKEEDGGKAKGSADRAAPSAGAGGKSKAGKPKTKVRADRYHYPAMTKTMVSPKKKSKFILHVEAGGFNDSQIVVMLGENGTGKTTFIKLLAGILEADPETKGGKPPKLEGMSMSLKPQKINPKFDGTVRALLAKKIPKAMAHAHFTSVVAKPLEVEAIIDNRVKDLSGGELQRVAICLALGKPAQIYLIDEPSAYLDSEQRVIAAKVIKRFIMGSKKTAFVVEHDFIMATYLADRVIVYEGNPGVEATATTPKGLLEGMNQFL